MPATLKRDVGRLARVQVEGWCRLHGPDRARTLLFGRASAWPGAALEAGIEALNRIAKGPSPWGGGRQPRGRIDDETR